MHLIIKATLDCNFSCTFCSAGLLKSLHKPTRVDDRIKERISVLEPDSITVAGGDPLMVEPSYYEDLLSCIKCPIGLVSNLKDFYLNPDKWVPTLSNPRIGVTTSFQYGNARKWDRNTVYTEDKFIEVMNLFKDKIGYMPSFIAVISEENEARALDHLLLAKRLGTKCRLNGQNAVGKSSTYYPRYKMIDIWANIFEQGLQDYCMEIEPFKQGNCAFDSQYLCQSTIRSCWVNSHNEFVYGNCEDLTCQGIRLQDPKEEKPEPKRALPKKFINENCKLCELCALCNSCYSNQIQAFKCPEYCDEMKKRIEKVKKWKWKI